MSLEQKLTEKEYYKTLLTDETSHQHPVEVLGHLYFAEQQNERCDLSYIRFSQGEIYFHHKDYESAIFKWENINNELADWAKKNMADAYFELDLLGNAEELYTSISSEHLVLTTEISIKLFSLYWERGKVSLAKDMIKKAVALNPDYPNVTTLARNFFEEQQDWGNAVELVKNEAIRTESMQWFEIMKDYADKGYVKNIAPSYFYEFIYTLYHLNQPRFEQFVSSLWMEYKEAKFFLDWLIEIDKLLSEVEINKNESWSNLAELYKQTYLQLMNGDYLFSTLQNMIPSYLTNWLRITRASEALFPATAILSWSELFPTSIQPEVIRVSENIQEQFHHSIELFDYSKELYQSISTWAQKQDLHIGHRFNWLVESLTKLEMRHILVAGTSERGKVSFRNTILGESILEGPSSSVMIIHDAEEESITEITDQSYKPVTNLAKYQYLTPSKQEKNSEAFLDTKIPSTFLHENHLSIIDTPCLTSELHENHDIFKYSGFADILLFVLNIHSPFTEKEREILIKIKEHTPNIHVHFLLTEIEENYSEEEVQRVAKVTKSKISPYFPDAVILPFKAYSLNSLDSLSQLIDEHFKRNHVKEDRAQKLLQHSKKMIQTLITTREELHQSLNQTIAFNEDMVKKLNGAINQLYDVEKEKISRITEAYRMIKDEIRAEMHENVPKILRNSSEFIREDHDFSKLHRELNDEMNRRIQEYFNTKVEPKFSEAIASWISLASDDFNVSKVNLEELSASLNELYGEEKINLSCDYKVLDDWRRDAERMTNRIHIENVDVLLRFTPGQFLLTSAGKIFGPFSQKANLYTKYKQYIENRNYEDIAETITKQFLQQFEFFEKALERDIVMFFKQPFNTLDKLVEATNKETENKKEALSRLNQNPEIFQDALTLFELRLRHYEWMNLRIMKQPLEY